MMLRSMGVRVGLSAIVGMLVSGLAEQALACTPPETGWILVPYTSAPANGVIWTSIACTTQCTPAPAATDVTLRGPSGSVPGTVTFYGNPADRRIVFKPDAPLEEGSTYSLTVAGARRDPQVPAASATNSFVVTAPVSWSPTPAVAEKIIAVDHPVGLKLCCGEEDSCGDRTCLLEDRLRNTAVSLRWDSTNMPAAEGNQYEFRVLEKGEPEPPWSYPFRTTLEMSEAQDSICYELELRRLVDGVVHRYPERCVERPADFGTYGVIPVDASEIAEICGGGGMGSGGNGGAGGDHSLGGGVIGGSAGQGSGGEPMAGSGGGDVGAGAAGATGGEAGDTATGTGGGIASGGRSTASGGTLPMGGRVSAAGGALATGGKLTNQGGARGGDTSTDGDDSGADDGGCTVSAAGGQSRPLPLAIAALGALFLFARRRQARRPE